MEKRFFELATSCERNQYVTPPVELGVSWKHTVLEMLLEMQGVRKGSR